MCLGIPGRVEAITDERGLRMGTVSFGGIQKPVCLAYVPEATVGEWVLVHVGFALSRIDEVEAHRVFELLREIDALEELET
ncbi:MAG TPA: HypC/HybG/HupF family hydrogenase formation chaperone [Sandaracinaceae bacterium LLY-WYZ-13_1]|nr:HypC/HybG/HupF family hydrogenase formation chaperone [Sandaracinaceae bacterium LLY-WYZ-13_1]